MLILVGTNPVFEMHLSNGELSSRLQHVINNITLMQCLSLVTLYKGKKKSPYSGRNWGTWWWSDISKMTEEMNSDLWTGTKTSEILSIACWYWGTILFSSLVPKLPLPLSNNSEVSISLAFWAAVGLLCSLVAEVFLAKSWTDSVLPQVYFGYIPWDSVHVSSHSLWCSGSCWFQLYQCKS